MNYPNFSIKEDLAKLEVRKAYQLERIQHLRDNLNDIINNKIPALQRADAANQALWDAVDEQDNGNLYDYILNKV